MKILIGGATMRKRTIKTVADTIFWYALYFLPVLAYLLFMISTKDGTNGWMDYIPFQQFFVNFVDIEPFNPVGDALYYIFDASEGIIPVFNDLSVYFIFSWFVYVYLIHLMVDFILFIPRLAHNWMNKFTRGDE